ncbi:hypothetical protein J6351_14555, partial [Burkholderia pseudomallei]|nr:hypothetical protein [Burkholderia pseudomallei]
MEVDSEARLLSVVLKPVDSESTLVEVDVDNEAIELVADERPVDVEVDSEARLLSMVLKPVDSEPMPVEVDVDNEATVLLVVDSPVDS